MMKDYLEEKRSDTGGYNSLDSNILNHEFAKKEKLS